LNNLKSPFYIKNKNGEAKRSIKKRVSNYQLKQYVLDKPQKHALKNSRIKLKV